MLGELSPEENEDVCHFLADASQYGFVVRTVEAPFFRRVVAEREHGDAGLPGTAVPAARRRPHDRARRADRTLEGADEGRPATAAGSSSSATTGRFTPSGFLPLALGNVLEDDLVEVYREHTLLRRIRAAEFSGRCGTCAFRTLCGGSRARAFAATGDPLASDPACALVAA